MTQDSTKQTLNRIFHRDHKKTQQKALDVLLSYLYNRYMVYTSDK